MYLVVTRNFPPELGGMQSLMWGLTNELSKNFLLKVFADFHESHKEFDKNSSFSITVRFFGSFLRINSVKLPVPGPISKIFLFVIFVIEIILFSIF